ncbi:MAG: 4-(cytidine 5'-diphospho)-2-C-methyl-D-erythritol kinase [Lachnospiraceae bacterium]|nr:4-(cytidine 5'-diphospho)-2-C-methyl-D-erythritol kinase [Lachnospiraceae bacterium]
MQEIRVDARAKINLGLDVVRRREDGYHEVKMIMQTVALYDTLTMTRLPESEIQITSNAGDIPLDEHNLIYKTARLMMEQYRIREGIKVHLEKRIPVAAGMAGGSTDAAATFKGMNELFQLGATEEELRTLAVKIGADVPYCIMGGTALSEGIGEILTPLPAPPQCYLLIAKPDLYVSTKYVYENLHANELVHHPDIDGMITCIREQDLWKMTALMENVLENVTVRKYPIIEEIKNIMKEQGAWNALMSGSGPTVFGIFTSEEEAEKAKAKIKEQEMAKQIFVSAFSNNG